MSAAAMNLTPVTLELGGKCHAILDSLPSSSDFRMDEDLFDLNKSPSHSKDLEIEYESIEQEMDEEPIHAPESKGIKGLNTGPDPAGNAGPDPVSLTNVSPWIATVGASTMDRDFPAKVKLGNGIRMTGVSLYRGRKVLSTKKQYPLVYMGLSNSSI